MNILILKNLVVNYLIFTSNPIKLFLSIIRFYYFKKEIPEKVLFRP